MRIVITLVWMALATLLLSACTTNAQRQAQVISESRKASAVQLRACSKAVSDLPEYQILDPHIPRDIRTATLEQLMDRSLVTDEEIAAVLFVHPKTQVCKEQYISQISSTTPTLGTIIATMFTKTERSLIDLLQRRKSWGDHIQSVKEIATQYMSEIAAEEQRINSGLAQSHANELQQRQAAANAITQFAQTQQIINAMNRPVFTNCTGLANTVNCISR